MSSARALAKVSVDWSKVTSKASPSDIQKLNRLKSRIDGVAVKVANLPESLPKIDWAYYKAHASDPKLAEELEKRYQAIKVEAPLAPQKRLAELRLAQEQDEARFKRFTEIANSYIESAGKVKEKFEKMIPVKDMTMEDRELTFPHWSIASIENPSIAPHNGRAPGLTREEAAAFDQPDPVPYATKTAWKDWETKYKKFYQ